MLDASALVEYLLRTETSRRTDIGLWLAKADLHVPALCDVEVASAFRRAMLQGKLSSHRAREAVQDLQDLPLTRHGHLALLPRVLELRNNFSAHDATYVALAEWLEAVLMTGDRPLGRAVQKAMEDESVKLERCLVLD